MASIRPVKYFCNTNLIYGLRKAHNLNMPNKPDQKKTLEVELGREAYLNAFILLLILLVLGFLAIWGLWHLNLQGWLFGLAASFVVIALFLFILLGGFCSSILAAGQQFGTAALVAQLDLVVGRQLRQLFAFDFGISRLSVLILANIAICQGRLLDAEKLLKPLLTSPESAELAGTNILSSIENGMMAQIYAWTGRQAEALVLVEKSLAEAESAYGLDQSEDQSIILAEAYCNAGCMLVFIGDCERALRVLLKALSMREKLFGESSEEVAKALNNLSLAQRESGDFAAAEESLRRAKRILETEKKDTTGGAILGYVLDSLAGVLLDQNKVDEAYELSRRALKLGQLDEHERSVRLFTMGRCLEQKGDTKAALTYYDRALKNWQEMQGFKHPLLERCRKSRSRLG
jgi:tetratricopeptide (TPR) repeat protein